MSRPSSVAKVMIPIPPTWIMTRMASSPNPDQKVAVSTTTRPVTHTAETVVNSAVTSPAAVPSSVATGSISRTVPIPTASANPATTAAAGRCNTASTGERRRVTALATPRRIEVLCASPPHRTRSDASFRATDDVSVAYHGCRCAGKPGRRTCRRSMRESSVRSCGRTAPGATPTRLGTDAGIPGPPLGSRRRSRVTTRRARLPDAIMSLCNNRRVGHMRTAVRGWSMR